MDSLFPINFSDSMLSDVWRCELSFFRRHCQRLYSGAKNPDLIAGGHIAKACEIVRNAYFTDKLSEEEAIELGKEYILKGEDTGDSIKTNDTLAYVLGKYFTKYSLEDSLPPCKLVDGTHAVEYKFEFDLGIPHPEIKNINLKFVGKLDYLCEEYILGKVKRYVLDEKTTKMIYRVAGSKGAINYAKEKEAYNVSGQFIAYHWAARQLGIETQASLIRRLPILATFEEAFELEIPINNFMIDQWYISTYNKILDLVEKYKIYLSHIKDNSKRNPQEVFYPIYKDGCNSFSRACAYKVGCMSKEGEQILEATFSQRVWSREHEDTISLTDYKRGLDI